MKTVVVFILSLVLTVSALSQDWKTFTVSYKLNGADKENVIYVPVGEGMKSEQIRGVMQNVGGPLKDFAHKNSVAMFRDLDDGRGFSRELLKAAAEASGKPEIEYAGAIVEGVSRLGREAAVWAKENQERAIAVILDHSFCYGIGTPVMVKGVPMYFNATYQNMFQDHDRRKLQFEWCDAGFSKKQPCTAVVDFVEAGGHGGRGTTTLTAIWLDESMNFRVPVNVPVGKPYALIDVDPSKCGGYVSAKLSMDGKRSYHDNVKITVKSSGAEWWMPGPKTAALYMDWVRKNGGKIELDESSKIKSFPVFNDLPASLKTAYSMIKNGQYGQANVALKRAKAKSPELADVFLTMISKEVELALKDLEEMKTNGDVYGMQLSLKDYVKTFRTIPEFDTKVKSYKKYFATAQVRRDLYIGQQFYKIIGNINKAKTVNLRPLKTFSEKNKNAEYGKVAGKVHAVLSADSAVKMLPQDCFSL